MQHVHLLETEGFTKLKELSPLDKLTSNFYKYRLIVETHSL
jgi:hypothetical protein